MIGTFRKIAAFAGSRRGLMGRSVLLTFVGALFSALQFPALMIVLDSVLSGNRDSRVSWMALGIMLISIAGKALTSYFSTIQQTEVGYCMVADKRVHIGDRLRYIPMGYFNQNSLGDITAVVTTTLGDVENSAARCMVAVLGGVLNSVALAVGICFFDWRIGLVVLAGIAVYLIATELAQRGVSADWPGRQRAQESLVAAVLEYIQGMHVVKAFRMGSDSGQRIGAAIDKSCEENLSVTKRVIPLDAVKQLVVRVAGVGIMVCALALYFAGQLSLVYCFLMLVASFMVYSDLESAGNMATLLQMMDASMEQANAIDKTPVMDTDGKEMSLQNGDITFENVDFSYGDRKVLDEVSLHIPTGTTTAIVGSSGGGKTTVCNLIARFWDVDDGNISVGGHDVREYKLDSLMAGISMVFQDVYLFQDTVENNIKFGSPNATREQVMAAARAACCDSFISALPDGYNTVVGEGGGSLSGGEKQRISIARAILKDAPIILLDEATSSVDPENEAELQRAIDSLTREKTIVMIAHRLKTVQNADQILVLDGGRIVQRGVHKELKSQPGLYADFLNARKEASGWKLA